MGDLFLFPTKLFSLILEIYPISAQNPQLFSFNAEPTTIKYFLNSTQTLIAWKYIIFGSIQLSRNVLLGYATNDKPYNFIYLSIVVSSITFHKFSSHINEAYSNETIDVHLYPSKISLNKKKNEKINRRANYARLKLTHGYASWYGSSLTC